MSLLKRVIEQKKEKKKLQEIIEKVTPSDERLISLIEPLIPEPVPGENGEDGDTPTTEQILELVKPLIPPPIPGEPGHTPTDEELLALIKPLIPEPVKGDDGHTPTEKELKAIIKPLIPPPIKGEKGDKPDHKWDDTKLMFEKPNGEWGKAVDLKGPIGETIKTEITRLGGSVSGGKTTIKEDGTTVATAASFLNFGLGFKVVADGSGVYVVSDNRYAVSIQTSDYTLTQDDSIVIFTNSATATLPQATGSGQTYRIVCRSGALTIDGDGTDTIIGDLTQTLSAGEDLIITDTEIGIWE